jgi:aspartyl-tRNA synthetase
MEASFYGEEDVMRDTEDLLRTLWNSQLPKDSIPEKFPRMTYHEAMSRYGSDKPDMRLEMEVCFFRVTQDNNTDPAADPPNHRVLTTRPHREDHLSGEPSH